MQSMASPGKQTPNMFNDGSRPEQRYSASNTPQHYNNTNMSHKSGQMKHSNPQNTFNEPSFNNANMGGDPRRG
jgi:hypothetical protein